MSDPLRVLVCVPWRERLGGAEAMLWTVLCHTNPRRVRYSVAFLESGPFESDVRERGFTTFRLEAGRLRQAGCGGRAIRRLSRIIRSHDPDVVLNWQAKAQLYGASAAIGAGLHRHRIVWWQHGVPGGHWMDRAATALPARAVGCSSHASAAAQRAVLPRRPTFVVHPGVEGERVTATDRDALGIAPGAPVIGIVGRLQPWKGQHRFLYALRQLHDAGCQAHGLVVGGSAHGFSPGYEQELRELVQRLALTDWVTMVGHVADTRPLIAAMDVMVSASAMEPFGIVLLEAFAQGIPVVAVADAGPREIVTHGVTGLLVPRPEPALVASAVRELLADEPRRAAMGEAARRTAVQQFGVQAMTEALAGELHSLTTESRAA